jgi:cell division protease FtsH
MISNFSRKIMKFAKISGFIIAFLAFITINSVNAERMTSSNFKVESDSINFGGGRSLSGSYTIEDTAGEVGTGYSTSTNFKIHADPVHKVTIISRGSAGGYTLKLPIEERKLQSKKEFIDDLAVSLGGYVAENTIFGDITTGPSNDLQVATSLARAMVTRWGMSDTIGPVALESNGGKPLFGRGVEDKDYSEKMSALIDDEVKKLMINALHTAEKVITQYRVVLDAIAAKLIEVETLEQEEYEEILKAYNIKLKK